MKASFARSVSPTAVVVLLLVVAPVATVRACEDLVVIPQEDLQAMLPPSPEWDASASAGFIVASDDPLVTPAEASGFNETATYEEVSEFYGKLAAGSDFVEVESLMTFPNGEDLWLVKVSGEMAFDKSANATNPIVYVTAGIHPGESSGVNAGMMFARNLATDPAYEDLLNTVNFFIVPIFNVQGYLRQSENGRMNQHGPNTSGRRGNGKNQNLNRDFSKLANPETRAIVSVFNNYKIAFYADLHSTDGVNYQDDITWCDNGDSGLSTAIYGWLRGEMKPALSEFLIGYNHLPGDCYLANDSMDPTAGSYPYFTDGTEYSTNYADHRQVPAYLLEMHSLKPNKQRVLGAYAFLYGVTSVVADKTESLMAVIEADQAARIDPVPVAWDYDDPPPMFNWSIFEYELVTNPVFNVDQIVWSDSPTTILVENSVRSVPLNPPTRPSYYYIPAVWTEVIDAIADHGIQYEVLTEEVTMEVVNYRIDDFEMLKMREGLYTVKGTPIPERCTRTYRTNDIRIPTDQSLGTLAVALLEPAGEQSFFYYGFFNSVFQQHESGANYIMIPIAEMILETYPEIADEWSLYLGTNPDFGAQDVNDWFFKKTAFYDHDAYVYPVGIVYANDTQSEITAFCPDPIVISQKDLQAMLPPSPEWDDSKHSESIVSLDDPFVTPAEATDFNETATYEEVGDYFTRLAAESEFVDVESLMKFANGEDLWLVKVSGEKAFTADAVTNPIFFVTGGIHAGESGGVNAGMMFARNLVMDPAYSELLNSVNFFFIPVFSVQGYLRQSSNGRINQYGPNTSGRRGNGKMQNLNRDFSKLMNPETRAVVSVFNEYNVSFYSDLHEDDGMNYAADVTWCDNGDAGLSNSIFNWLRTEMAPDLSEFLESYNHNPGPCYYPNDEMDPMAGFYPYLSDGPEYSTNYADHRQIPAYLLELHSLKPNKQRVLGAYAYLHGIASVIANKTESLLTAIAEDRAARIDPVPISWDYNDPPPMYNWSVFEWSVVSNPTFNVDQIIWTDIPMTIEVENSVRSVPLDPPARPQYYYIPAVWSDVIGTLSAHGIPFDVLTEEVTVDVVHYRMMPDLTFGLREGRATASGAWTTESCTRTYKPNDVRVPTDHPLGTLAVALLEPRGEQSFFYYGFFNSVFSRAEYAENYIMLPIAERLVADHPDIASNWEAYAAENPDYGESDVVEFFFPYTEFSDRESYLYPVGIGYYATEVATLFPTDPDPDCCNEDASGALPGFFNLPAGVMLFFGGSVASLLFLSVVQ